MNLLSGIFTIPAILSLSLPSASAAEYKAGIARAVITPKVGVWMAGYASRDKPAQAKLHDLWAKAVALEDADGHRLVFISTDLIGFPRSISESIARQVESKTGLDRAALMLTSSHTHCGPVLRDNLMDMYPVGPDQRGKIDAYANRLIGITVKLVENALADLKPANLEMSEGVARFAINRREFPKSKSKILGANTVGPTDHSVPVLAIKSPSGELRAAIFGYACHNTTLSFFQWCGDYAGFAQIEFEKMHPGTTALFWSGCAGDQNPHPRRKVELAEKYGKQLAQAVDSAVKSNPQKISGTLQARYETIPLALGKQPTRDQLTADTISNNLALHNRANRFIKILDKGGMLPTQYDHYPIQTWHLGDKLLWVALGGEVTVEYALRIKKELGNKQNVWVTAYANDVPAYIPSERVLAEGGYEGDTSMIYYGLPTKWAPGLEDKIIRKVHELAE